MIKKLLKKYLPSEKEIKNHSNLGWLHNYLLDPAIWHFSHHAVAKGIGIGIFVAFIPLPFQMLLAAVIAIGLRGNLPLAVAFTWISNPITFIPLNYLIFKVGQWITHDHSSWRMIESFTWKGKSWTEFSQQFIVYVKQIGKPYLIGLPIVASIASIGAYLIVQIIWQVSMVFKRRKATKHPRSK